MKHFAVEDRDGVIWIWNPQHGHIKASSNTSTYLHIERLAQRYKRVSFVFNGKVRPVPLFPLLVHINKVK